MYSSFSQRLQQLAFSPSKSESIHATELFIAYSGGLDSTVLLHLSAQFARQHQLDITAIHINHGLSDNALGWQRHCAQVCDELKVKFIAQSVKVKTGGQGLEGQARVARYDGLASVIERNANGVKNLLLTGQHQQDKVETFFLQLKRGAGNKGLAAMAATSAFRPHRLRNTHLLRPLLDVSREQLKAYAEQHGLSWIEDESNADTRFDRNFLRADVLPLLNQRWPQFDGMVSRSVQHLSEQQQLVDEISAQDLLKLQHQDDSLCCVGLLSLSLLRRNNALRYWFTNNGVSMPSTVLMGRINDEVLQARIDANPQVSWQQSVLRRFKARLYLTGKNADCGGQAQTFSTETFLTANTIELLDSQGGLLGSLQVNRAKSIANVDKSENQNLLRTPNADERVTIGFAQHGQFNQLKCQRAGHKITQKLGDLFKYYQVPPWQRNRTPLIYYNQQLVAVAGLFVCEQGAMQNNANEASNKDKGLEIKIVINN